MTTEQLKRIRKTTAGYEVKDLKYKEVDNIIIGFVKDPLWGKPELHDGFISCQWRTSGHPIKRIAGRTDLTLKMPKDLEIKK